MARAWRLSPHSPRHPPQGVISPLSEGEIKSGMAGDQLFPDRGHSALPRLILLGRGVTALRLFTRNFCRARCCLHTIPLAAHAPHYCNLMPAIPCSQSDSFQRQKRPLNVVRHFWNNWLANCAPRPVDVQVSPMGCAPCGERGDRKLCYIRPNGPSLP